MERAFRPEHYEPGQCNYSLPGLLVRTQGEDLQQQQQLVLKFTFPQATGLTWAVVGIIKIRAFHPRMSAI